MGFKCGDCGHSRVCDPDDCWWETSWTADEALRALRKFRILDEVENELPPCLVEWLRDEGAEYGVASHQRFEGATAIWWFDSWKVDKGYRMHEWPSVAIEDREAKSAAERQPAAPVCGAVGGCGEKAA